MTLKLVLFGIICVVDLAQLIAFQMRVIIFANPCPSHCVEKVGPSEHKIMSFLCSEWYFIEVACEWAPKVCVGELKCVDDIV